MSLQITPWPTTIVHAMILLFLWLTIFFIHVHPPALCATFTTMFQLMTNNNWSKYYNTYRDQLGFSFLLLCTPDSRGFMSLDNCAKNSGGTECFTQSMVQLLRLP